MIDRWQMADLWAFGQPLRLWVLIGRQDRLRTQNATIFSIITKPEFLFTDKATSQYFER